MTRKIREGRRGGCKVSEGGRRGKDQEGGERRERRGKEGEGGGRTENEGKGGREGKEWEKGEGGR